MGKPFRSASTVTGTPQNGWPIPCPVNLVGPLGQRLGVSELTARKGGPLGGMTGSLRQAMDWSWMNRLFVLSGGVTTRVEISGYIDTPGYITGTIETQGGAIVNVITETEDPVDEEGSIVVPNDRTVRPNNPLVKWVQTAGGGLCPQFGYGQVPGKYLVGYIPGGVEGDEGDIQVAVAVVVRVKVTAEITPYKWSLDGAFYLEHEISVACDLLYSLTDGPPWEFVSGFYSIDSDHATLLHIGAVSRIDPAPELPIGYLELSFRKADGGHEGPEAIPLYGDLPSCSFSAQCVQRFIPPPEI